MHKLHRQSVSATHWFVPRSPLCYYRPSATHCRRKLSLECPMSIFRSRSSLLKSLSGNYPQFLVGCVVEMENIVASFGFFRMMPHTIEIFMRYHTSALIDKLFPPRSFRMPSQDRSSPYIRTLSFRETFCYPETAYHHPSSLLILYFCALHHV